MKKIIYCVVISLFVCVSAHAQNEENAVSEEMNVATETQEAESVAEELVVSQEVAAELARPTLLCHSVLSNYSDDYKENPSWRKARRLRTAGIITTCVGGVVGVVYGAIAIDGANSDNLGKIFIAMNATGLALCGAAVGVAGGIMWIVGNHKMKKARLSANGAGLAYTF